MAAKKTDTDIETLISKGQLTKEEGSRLLANIISGKNDPRLNDPERKKKVEAIEKEFKLNPNAKLGFGGNPKDPVCIKKGKEKKPAPLSEETLVNMAENAAPIN